jgi:hypothetical protein
MNKFWSMVRERAVRDRESYLEAWGETGNLEVIAQTNAEISRFNAFKGMTFKQSLVADKEGVRLALLCAEIWYESLAECQVGKEKQEAIKILRRVYNLRMKLFGQTRIEAALSHHRTHALIPGKIFPTELFADMGQK